MCVGGGVGACASVYSSLFILLFFLFLPPYVIHHSPKDYMENFKNKHSMSFKQLSIVIVHLALLLVITIKLVPNSSMKFYHCSSKGPVSGLLWGSLSMSAVKTGVLPCEVQEGGRPATPGRNTL